MIFTDCKDNMNRCFVKKIEDEERWTGVIIMIFFDNFSFPDCEKSISGCNIPFKHPYASMV